MWGLSVVYITIGTAVVLLFPGIVNALDYCSVPNGATYTINEHSTCRRVTNSHASGQAIFVATKTAAEWSTGPNSFINATPPGVTILACTCGNTDWSSASAGPIVENPSPVSGEWFGVDVAISGNLIAASDINDNSGRGRIYAINATTGSVVSTFAGLTANSYTGYSIGIDGTNIAAGAPQAPVGATSTAGKVYIIDANTGTLLRTIDNPEPATGDVFGNIVDISGSLVAIASPLDDGSGSDTGRVYIYNAITGALVRTINNPSPTSGDRFGEGLAIHGNRVVIAAAQDDTGASNAGIAFVFDATTGTLLSTFNNPTPASGDRMGRSILWTKAIDIENATAAVSAIADDTGGSDAGSVYIFNATTGALIRTINNPTPTNPSFGNSLSINNGYISITTPANFTAGTFSIRVYDIATGAQKSVVTLPGNAFAGSAPPAAISGSALVAGNATFNPGSGIVGRVYVYNAQAGVCASCAP